MTDPVIPPAAIEAGTQAYERGIGPGVHRMEDMVRAILAAALPHLRAHETRAVVDREALDHVLEEHEIVWRPDPQGYSLCWCGWLPDAPWESDGEFMELYRDHRTDAVLALLNGSAS